MRDFYENEKEERFSINNFLLFVLRSASNQKFMHLCTIQLEIFYAFMIQFPSDVTQFTKSSEKALERFNRSGKIHSSHVIFSIEKLLKQKKHERRILLKRRIVLLKHC